MAESEHSGQCLCGAVRFRTSGALRDVIYCHCTQCRRQTGHMVAATASADADLTVEGSDQLTWYSASPDARRGFCRVCGSMLFWKAEGRASTSIMAGAFERPTGLKGLIHIFVGDKGDYYAIDDDLPQHEFSSGPTAPTKS